MSWEREIEISYVILAGYDECVLGQTERVERNIGARFEEKSQQHVAMNHVSCASQWSFNNKTTTKQQNLKQD